MRRKRIFHLNFIVFFPSSWILKSIFARCSLIKLQIVGALGVAYLHTKKQIFCLSDVENYNGKRDIKWINGLFGNFCYFVVQCQTSPTIVLVTPAALILTCKAAAPEGLFSRE